MRGKQEIFQHFSKILDKQIQEHPFWAYYYAYPFSMEEVCGRNVKVVCGASRGCMIDRNYDWVVKWNLDGVDTNYCEIEEQMYEKAVAAGVEDCFAPVYFLGTYRTKVWTWPALSYADDDWYCDGTDEDFMTWVENNELTEEDMEEVEIELPLWCARKAQDAFDLRSSEESEESAREYDSPLVERAIEIGAAFVETYGVDMYYELSAFLNENGVNDIHYGNIGMLDGEVVLIDYAGYYC